MTSALEWSTSHPGCFIRRERAPWYPLDRRLGGPHSQSGCSGEENNSQFLPALKPLIIYPIPQCYITELFIIKWFLFK